MRRLIPILTVCIVLAGCASLGRVDPNTGTTPAQDIQASANELAPLLPPPFNLIVPGAIGTVLTVLTAVGKAKEE